MTLKSRNFLTMMEYTAEELWSIIKKTSEFKRNPQSCDAVLRGKHVALLFQKPSTRTRISFEVAVNQLGGSTIFLPSAE
ncbi:MAG: ornithine carbamoyltransferase, partial [Candidatus Bathyarchaeia archaeon]